jgi:hypothetical protein
MNHAQICPKDREPDDDREEELPLTEHLKRGDKAYGDGEAADDEDCSRESQSRDLTVQPNYIVACGPVVPGR